MFWRVDGDHSEQSGRLFLDGYTLPLHFRGQTWQCDLHAVVDIDSVDIGIGAELERTDQRVAAVIAADTLHVDHFVDADDLRFDRLGNCRIDHGGICTRVRRGHLYLR